MNKFDQIEQQHKDVYPDRLLDGRVYKEVTAKTIELAFTSYKTARFLSILSFIVGMSLLISAMIVAISETDSGWLSALLAAFGTANIIALLVTHPVERIQSGINNLLEAQIACLNFAASYESIARYLVASSELPFDNKDRDLHKEFERAKFLMDSALRSASHEHALGNSANRAS